MKTSLGKHGLTFVLVLYDCEPLVSIPTVRTLVLLSYSLSLSVPGRSIATNIDDGVTYTNIVTVDDYRSVRTVMNN